MEETRPPKALVFGATGFLGSNLLAALNRAGIAAAVFRRETSSLKNLKGCRYDDFTGSLDDEQALRSALKDCGTVFNLAAKTTFLSADAPERERVNAAFPKRLCAILRDLSRPLRLVHCSSVGTITFSRRKPVVHDEAAGFDAADIHYFASKKAGEEAVLSAARAGLDAVIVNPGTLIGPQGMSGVQRETFARIAAGSMLFAPPGGTCLSFVPDVVRGMLLAAKKGRRGERYILGGTNLRFADYYAEIAGACGGRPPRITVPRSLAPLAGGLMEAGLGKMGADLGRLASGWAYYSSQKACAELGYRITPLPEAIVAVIKGLREPCR